MRKATKKERKQLRPYWLELQELLFEHDRKVSVLERKMSETLGKDWFFFWSNGYCGIGDESRNVKLITEEEFNET